MLPTREGGISQKSVGNVITRPCTVQCNPGKITTQPLARTNVGKKLHYSRSTPTYIHTVSHCSCLSYEVCIRINGSPFN